MTTDVLVSGQRKCSRDEASLVVIQATSSIAVCKSGSKVATMRKCGPWVRISRRQPLSDSLIE